MHSILCYYISICPWLQHALYVFICSMLRRLHIVLYIYVFYILHKNIYPIERNERVLALAISHALYGQVKYCMNAIVCITILCVLESLVWNCCQHIYMAWPPLASTRVICEHIIFTCIVFVWCVQQPCLGCLHLYIYI